jgi:hypothetical protein
MRIILTRCHSEEDAMRAVVTHDEAGNIIRIVVGPTGAPAAGVVPEPSLLTSEVDISDLDLDLADPTLEARLLGLIAQHQIVRDAGTERARLTRR